MIHPYVIQLRMRLYYVLLLILYAAASSLASKLTFVHSAPFDALFTNLFVFIQVSPLKNPQLLQYQLLLQVVMRLLHQNKENKVKLIDGTLITVYHLSVAEHLVLYSSVPLLLQVCQRNPHLLPHQFLL